MKWGYNYDLISRIVNQASVADEEKLEEEPVENEGQQKKLNIESESGNETASE